MRKKGPPIVVFVILAALVLLIGAGVVFNFLKKGPGTGSDQKVNFVALGASTTKANNLSSKLSGDHPEYSFATGTKVESFYLYLKKKGEDTSPRNLAESGANSQKVLSQQVPNAVSYKPQYVTIDIMADIFEEENPIKFKQNLTEIVKQVKISENTVLIGTYPNLVLMRQASFPACSEDKLNLGIAKVTEEKLKLFNQAVSEVARENDLILVDNFETLGPEDVSDYDCLHPNIAGQRKLAKAWIAVLEKGVNKK